MSDEKRDDGQSFLIYQDDNGISNVTVRFEGEDVWLTQQQLAELFLSSRTNVVEHIQNIYQDKELEESATCRNFRQVRIEGQRRVSRNLPHYNLDMILAIGMRIRSEVAVRFRQWAIRHLALTIVFQSEASAWRWLKFRCASGTCCVV